MLIPPRVSVPAVKREQLKHTVWMIFLKSFLTEREAGFRRKAATTVKKNQLSKHNKAKSSHSPGPTTFSPAKSLA